jgi:hypothetical protein
MCHSNNDTESDISADPTTVDDEAVTAEPAAINDEAVTTEAVATINKSLADDVIVSTQTRTTNYTENEILILACARVKVSTDPVTRTDQKSATF